MEVEELIAFIDQLHLQSGVTSIGRRTFSSSEGFTSGCSPYQREEDEYLGL